MTVHAEANAVLNAHRVGARVSGCDLYVTAFPPCASCSNVIVQAGIKRVFCYPTPERNDTLERWREDIIWGEVIRREGGVETIYMERNPCQA
jgi:deoxycytidylate deaminase